MSARPAAYYEARLALTPGALLPAAGLPVFVLVTLLLNEGTLTGLDPRMAVSAFIILLPLAVGLASAHLMGLEREDGFAELRHTYPEPAVRLPAWRIGCGLLLGALCLGLGWVAAWAAGVRGLTLALLAEAAPGSLLLLGVALLAGQLSGSYWAAAGISIGYWFLELVTRGQLTGPLFLFEPVWPRGAIPLSQHQALLAAAGAALVALAAGAHLWRRRPG